MVRPDQGLKINLQPFSLSLGLPKKPCLLPKPIQEAAIVLRRVLLHLSQSFFLLHNHPPPTVPPHPYLDVPGSRKTPPFLWVLPSWGFHFAHSGCRQFMSKQAHLAAQLSPPAPSRGKTEAGCKQGPWKERRTL